MKILVVNDDGIKAEGLKILVEKAKKYGEVTVIAPIEQQSAKSHSITLGKKIVIEESKEYDVEAYMINSTPADCVRTAKYGLNIDFDIVFSGINKGYNVGEDITYSGTVAAVIEAAFMGIPAIAFSTFYQTFEAAEYIDESIEYIFNNKLFDYCKTYNVNLPQEARGIRITKQGDTHFTTYFKESNEGYSQEGYPDFSQEGMNVDTDTGAIYNKYISITPLTIDRTDLEVYKKLKK